MKKCIAFLSTMVFMFVFCFSMPVSASDGPVFAPAIEEKGKLESYTTEQYVGEDGIIITEETLVYDCTLARATTTKKKVAKNYIFSTSQAGDILVITLDADFYYTINGSVYCDRYYSSYKVCNEGRLVSYEETDMDYTEGEESAMVKTYYKIKYLESDVGLKDVTKTKTPSIWVSVDNIGHVTSGAK